MIVNIIPDRLMKLPQKDHFSLGELAERWRAPMTDIQYFAEHGMLDVQTWLDLPAVELFRLKKTEDGDRVPVSVGLDSYHDYVVVDPTELRKIFRSEGRSPIAKYRPVTSADLIKSLVPSHRVLVAANDLVVSRADRDEFERAHGIVCGANRGVYATSTNMGHAPPTTHVSFAGRPSVMHRIVQHFDERRTQKVLNGSLQKEGEYLYAWAQSNITDSQIPGARTIMNAIRVPYRRNAQQ